MLPWLIDRYVHQVVIDQKYADDITFVTTEETKMNKVRRLLPNLLKEGNLTENESKREGFRIPDEKNLWKKCECLGPLMDKESDINRRLHHQYHEDTRAPAKVAHSNHPNQAESFQSLCQSIFLYNNVNYGPLRKPLQTKLILFDGSCFGKSWV